MFDRLDLIEKRYQEIQDRVASGKLEIKEMTELLKESSNIQETVETYRFFKAKRKFDS
jgi:peptide chain release factor 1